MSATTTYKANATDGVINANGMAIRYVMIDTAPFRSFPIDCANIESAPWHAIKTFVRMK